MCLVEKKNPVNWKSFYIKGELGSFVMCLEWLLSCMFETLMLINHDTLLMNKERKTFINPNHLINLFCLFVVDSDTKSTFCTQKELLEMYTLCYQVWLSTAELAWLPQKLFCSILHIFIHISGLPCRITCRRAPTPQRAWGAMCNTAEIGVNKFRGGHKHPCHPLRSTNAENKTS